MTAWYNEIDENAAEWLRELIRRGHIADGIVDTRSIEDVLPADLAGFTQCHFFAGIGVWSYALRRAGWPDNRPVWTGSCPCQPFSAAGKGGGFDDERHLWPAWHWLIEQRGPAVVFGEQVASKDADPWIDLVQADLEALGYAVGAQPFPSAGIGAPHIRDRLYWVADAESRGRRELGHSALARRVRHPDSGLFTDRMGLAAGGRREGSGEEPEHSQLGQPGETIRLADDDRQRQPGRQKSNLWPIESEQPAPRRVDAGGRRTDGWMGHAERFGSWRDAGTSHAAQGGHRGGHVGDDPRSPGAAVAGLADAVGGQLPEARRGEVGRIGQPGVGQELGPAGPVNGLWRDADWLFCRDGKWRPVEPGTFPLAHGAPARVGRLRGYGNAINAEAATHWIEIYLEAEADRRGLRLDAVLTDGVFA